MEALLITVISELFTLAGVIITCWLTHSKTVYRIEQLEKKQDKHNCLIERMYNCEKQIEILETKMEQ